MNFIITFLRKDIWIKLFALVFAVALYLNLHEPEERHISKNIPVIPEITGKTAPGKTLAAVRCNPDSVIVSGPAEIVNAIHEIRTGKISIDGESVDFKKEIDLATPDNDKLTFSNNTTSVSVEIKDAASKKIPDLQVRYLLGSQNVAAEKIDLPEVKVTLTVTGTQGAIDDISRENIMVFADLSAVTEPGEYTENLQVNFSGTQETVKVISLEPAEVKVTIPSKKTQQESEIKK